MHEPRLTPDLDLDALLALLDHVVVSAEPVTTTQRSPLDLARMLPVPHTDAAAADRAFAEARAAQPAWAALPIGERVAIIRRFHDLVLEEREALCDVVQWENGKARSHAMDEVFDVAITAQYYSGLAPKLLGSKRRRGAFPLVTRTREVLHPKGVVGIISPWNYPLCIGISDMIPALLAGNAVVWKPDLQTAVTAAMALDLLYAAGVPQHIVRMLNGEGGVVGPFITERADKVMFTGSTAVGREVAATAARRLVDVSLELGGKNSCIVMADADIDRAVDVALRGAFANAGQLCIGTERVLVHASIERAFTDAFVEAAQSMALGPIIGWGSDMGPLVSPQQLARTQAHVDEAVAKGAVVLTGGHARPDLGPLMYAPTILTGVTDDMAVCATETFGPVCAVYTWADEAELLARVNDTEYGLSAAIVSRDVRAARRLATRVRAGSVNINEPYGSAWASVDAPMGGMGASGLGRRHGRQGLLKYTESQTVSSQHVIALAPQGPLDDAAWARLVTVLLRVMKALHLR